MLSLAGGSFPLTALADFGSSFGIRVLSIQTESSNPAGNGFLQLANTDSIGWRNSGNTADLLLQPNADGILKYNSVDLVNLSASQTLTNKAITGTFTGSLTGNASTASQVTATSNSTLVTLSALSLPGSQVTGNISGNAANVTATSNSTLTTLSGLTTASVLASIGTITTGVWNAGAVTSSGTIRTTGAVAPASGSGVETDFGAAGTNTGRIFAYNRSSSARLPMIVDGSTTALYSGGTQGLLIDASQNATFAGALNVTTSGNSALTIKSTTNSDFAAATFQAPNNSGVNTQFQIGVNTQNLNAIQTYDQANSQLVDTYYNGSHSGGSARILYTAGAAALSIDGSQNITLGSGTSNQHVLNTKTATGSGTSTLGTANSPGASTPAGWIQITVNGATHYIPYF